MGLTNHFQTKVVGLTFVSGYPDNVLRLRETMETQYISDFGADSVEGLPVVLVRNPDNEFDANAIQVHVPMLGDDAMIGHLPRAVAERLAPELDAGQVWHSALTMVAVDPNHPTNPGVTISLTRATEGDPF